MNVLCRCWDGPGVICKRAATHMVGERRSRSFPLPCCDKHAAPYKEREQRYAVISLTKSTPRQKRSSK